MAKLSLAVGRTDGLLQVSEAIDVGSYPAPYRLEDECILIVGGDGSSLLSVQRGLNGTAPAAHAAGVTLESGWADQVEAGIDEAAHEALDHEGLPGVGGAVTIADADPGALGAGALWLQTNLNGSWMQLKVRDASDTGWENVTPLVDTGAGTQQLATPDGQTGTVSIGDDSIAIELDARDSEGNAANSIVLNARNDDENYANSIRVGDPGVSLGDAGAHVGFFGATPEAQPAAVADATDAASTQARLNDLLARLRTLGIIAT